MSSPDPPRPSGSHHQGSPGVPARRPAKVNIDVGGSGGRHDTEDGGVAAGGGTGVFGEDPPPSMAPRPSLSGSEEEEKKDEAEEETRKPAAKCRQQPRRQAKEKARPMYGAGYASDSMAEGADERDAGSSPWSSSSSSDSSWKLSPDQKPAGRPPGDAVNSTSSPSAAVAIRGAPSPGTPLIEAPSPVSGSSRLGLASLAQPAASPGSPRGMPSPDVPVLEALSILSDLTWVSKGEVEPLEPPIFASEEEWWLVDLEARPIPTQGATPLVKQCMFEYGWDAVKALGVLRAYRQFLSIKTFLGDYNAKFLSPSASVDRMWHLHIVDTQNYASDCKLLCGGRFLPHNPRGAQEGAERDARRRRTRETLLLYKAELGLEYEEWKELFQNPASPHVLATPNPDGEPTIDLVIRCLCLAPITVHVPPVSGRMSDVFDLVAAETGGRPTRLLWTHKGRVIAGHVSPSDLQMEAGSVIFFSLIARGC